MAKKILLETRTEPAFFTLIGISCHLMDYRLLYAFNNQLDFNFIKEKDFPAVSVEQKTESSFSFYTYKDEDHRNSFYLFANKNPDFYLLPTLKQADFLLLIEGPITKPRKESLLNGIRSIPKVLTSFEIKFTQVKNYEAFLTDLELHIMEIEREKKQKSKQLI
jgi:hypothetical protein